MESFSRPNKQEKETDQFLQVLWGDYEFSGRPPYVGSLAETRLKSICGKYAVLMDDEHHSPEQTVSTIKISDNERRKLHNELALILVGRQRSGMTPGEAEHIAQFAYEYSRGYKLSDKEKFKRD